MYGLPAPCGTECSTSPWRTTAGAQPRLPCEHVNLGLLPASGQKNGWSGMAAGSLRACWALSRRRCGA
eukprot:4704098-Alexandrium_andersonii.AAC.1